jgi:ribosomal-protein-alanine N-acetyltransferase
MSYPKIEIETARLRLRTFVPEDGKALFRLWDMEEVTRYIRPGWKPTWEHIENYLARTQKRWDEHGFSHLAMTLKEDGTLIGYCGFQYVEETPNVELLYGMEPLYWNQGYVTEAARACLRFAYEQTELDRIIALSYPANTGSWRVMEKLGMKYEGMAHYYTAELRCYAMTREEFQPGSAPYAFKRL